MTEEIQRTLGEHDAHIIILQNDMAELKADVKIILSTLSEARGGWKTLMLGAGAAGVIGAFIAKLFPFFPKG